MINRREVMNLNHQLYTTGHFTQSEALKTAWQLVKGVQLSARGVTFGKRQLALAHLMKYPRRLVSITLLHQAHTADPQAVIIVVTVHGKGSYPIGFISREWAQALAPLLDAGQTLAATFHTVTGGREYGHFGLRFSVQVA